MTVRPLSLHQYSKILTFLVKYLVRWSALCLSVLSRLGVGVCGSIWFEPLNFLFSLTFVSKSLQWYLILILSDKCLVVCSWHNTLQHKPLHTVILDVLFCLAQVFICFQIPLPVPCCIRPRMTVTNGWGLNCLTNVGVEAGEPKLEGQRSSGDSTTHVIDVPPLAWRISCSVTGASRVHRALHLYFVSLLVFVFNSVLLIKSRPLTLPSPASSFSRTRF